MESLLRTYADTDCIDPLDKVYALVSMSELAREHLAISYDTDRLGLLLSTLEFSYDKDGLGPDRTTSLAFELMNQLKITKDDLNPRAQRRYIGHTRTLSGPRIPDLPLAGNILFKIGWVGSILINANLFETMQALREGCDRVGHFDTNMSFLYLFPRKDTENHKH